MWCQEDRRRCFPVLPPPHDQKIRTEFPSATTVVCALLYVHTVNEKAYSSLPLYRNARCHTWQIPPPLNPSPWHTFAFKSPLLLPPSSLLPSAAAAFWICGYPLSLSVPLCRPAEMRPSFSRALPSPPHSGCLWGKEARRGTEPRDAFLPLSPQQPDLLHPRNEQLHCVVCVYFNSLALSISHSLCLHGIAAAAPLLLISAAARSLSLAALAAAAEFSCTLLASQGSTSDTEPHGTSFRHE